MPLTRNSLEILAAVPFPRLHVTSSLPESASTTVNGCCSCTSRTLRVSPQRHPIHSPLISSSVHHFSKWQIWHDLKSRSFHVAKTFMDHLGIPRDVVLSPICPKQKPTSDAPPTGCPNQRCLERTTTRTRRTARQSYSSKNTRAGADRLTWYSAPSGGSTMEMTISAISLMFAGISLGWQICAWLLSSGRPKATLITGLFSPPGGAFVGPVSKSGERVELNSLRAQNIPGEEVIGVKVTDRGRIPITVEHIEICDRHKGQFVYQPIDELLGPSLPHSIEAGTNESWYVPLQSVEGFSRLSREPVSLYIVVTLGSGKRIKTRASLRIS